jgi:hypothetical protein
LAFFEASIKLVSQEFVHQAAKDESKQGICDEHDKANNRSALRSMKMTANQMGKTYCERASGYKAKNLENAPCSQFVIAWPIIFHHKIH